MSEYRIKTSEQVGSNMSFEIYDLVRVDHRVVGGSPTHGTHVPIIGRAHLLDTLDPGFMSADQTVVSIMFYDVRILCLGVIKS